MNAIPLAIIYLVATLLLGALPYTTTDGLLQNLYLAAASAFLAVFLGLVAVNLILNSKERRKAAAPLLQLIGELVEPLHNELFIQLGRDTFGIEKFNRSIDTYAENRGSPEAFSPEDQDKLYTMIASKKDELNGIYARIETTARDVASILGWGYDPTILRAVLMTRSNILGITRLMALGAHDGSAKRKIIEYYFDIDGATSAWAHGLARKLGIPISN